MLGILEKLSPQDLAALGVLALALVTCLVCFPCYLAFVALTGCGPARVQSVCSYILRLAKRRSKFNYHKIDNHLYLGSLPRTMEDLEELKSLGVGAMVTLNEAWEMELSNKFVRDSCGIEHLHLPTPDFFAPKQEDIEAAVHFITAHVRKGIGVYVHCNGGKGRSAVCVICFLASFMDLSPELAYDRAPMRGVLGLHKQWRAVKRFCRRVSRMPKRFEAFAEESPVCQEVTAKPQELATVHVADSLPHDEPPLPRKDAEHVPVPAASTGEATTDGLPPELHAPVHAPPPALNVPPEPTQPPCVPQCNHYEERFEAEASSDSDEEPPLLE
ncbi:unnamed protein product [Durusdinium trenchii]|uniref:Uncharacterized protein n=2 Tax=Durusdinium trenchii TaxID=1381693 RepID=A0ABP0NGM5_9DINO